MHNPSGLLEAPSAPQRFVRVKPDVRGFVQGNRYVTPSDGPFPVDDYRAAELVRQGLAEPCAQIAVAGEVVTSALNPGPASAERATGRRQRAVV